MNQLVGKDVFLLWLAKLKDSILVNFAVGSETIRSSIDLKLYTDNRASIT